MRFALFYEIPVARPWDEQSELRAYQNTIEQAVAGDRFGWDAFWTVEHHFLSEYSHCSNPEVLYGAIASRTERIRLGYGVRLMPKPYNHPVRTAESVAVLDLVSNGRVDMGTGRSSTRPELEGFGIDPHETREMWQEAIGHIVGCWTNDEYEFSGKYWDMPKRRVIPKPIQKPHPPLWGATTSDDGHRQVGSLGMGLCSFAVGVSPEEVKRRIDIYREAVEGCDRPIGKYVHNQAATFTMTVCGDDRDASIAAARDSFEWYPKTGARQIATVAEWMAERQQDLGNYSYAADMKKTDDEGMLDLLSMEYLIDEGACVVGTPADCIEACRRYEAAGVDLLLCLVNPWKIPHETVMRTIELMGTEVIPQFSDGRTPMSGPLDGYGALVTGGGSGIGLAVAKRLLADGATVTICGRNKERLDAAVKDIGGDARRVVADVTVEDDVAGAVAAAADAAPQGLRIAVANAGGSTQMGPLVATGLEEFRDTVEVNVVGTFLTIKHAAPHLVRNGGGSIVAVSSIAAAVSHPYLGAYAVGKAGIDMLVKVAADELGRSNVRVNAVRPGLVDTELVAGILATPDVLDSYLTQTPLGRAGQPDEIAELIRFLAGPESAWITGQAISIDGGHSLRRGPDYTPFAEPVYGADALRGIPPSPPT